MKLKSLALLVTAAMATCAPAHARSTVDLAFEACNKLTQTVISYQESGMSRAEVDVLADRAISVPVMRDLLGEMFDIADAERLECGAEDRSLEIPHHVWHPCRCTGGIYPHWSGDCAAPRVPNHAVSYCAWHLIGRHRRQEQPSTATWELLDHVVPLDASHVAHASAAQ